MRSTLLISVILAALVLPLAAQADTTRTVDRFYLHRAPGEGTTCGTDLYLDTVKSPGDAGCTPTFRVQNQLFEDEDIFSLRSSELPLTLDATEDLTGVMAMNGGSGAADFDLVVTVSGTREGEFFPVTLGSAEAHMTLTTLDSDTLEYTIDIDDELDGAVLTALSVTVELKNTIAALGPSHELDGESHITVPVIKER